MPQPIQDVIKPGANLRNAKLSGVDLRGADLRYVDLRGADLSDADLRDADLSDADLSDADLSDADLSDAYLRDADLSDADLSGANLSDADLSDANLSGADLRGANLSDANLSGANLSDANLSDANLRGANLSGAKGLISASEYLVANCEACAYGIIVYKAFDMVFSPPKTWRIEKGAYITENVHPDRTQDCGCGVNVSTLKWQTKPRIWKCLIEWKDLPDVVVPYGTDGKFRAGRVKLLREVIRERE